MSHGCQQDDSSFFRKFSKNFRNVKYYHHIWNQHGKCFKMSTNKPMFGSAVLEIVCQIFVNKTLCFLRNIENTAWRVTIFKLLNISRCQLNDIMLLYRNKGLSYLVWWYTQSSWKSQVVNHSLRIREDMKHFPQCITSNRIFCTGGHVGW